MCEIQIEEGREVFGRDAANYDAARPDYPDRVYAVLQSCCGLKPGAAVFEIGPGTGLATRHLLAAGAGPVLAIEPDARLAAVLRERSPSPALQLVNAPFETADLPGPNHCP